MAPWLGSVHCIHRTAGSSGRSRLRFLSSTISVHATSHSNSTVVFANISCAISLAKWDAQHGVMCSSYPLS